MARDIKTVVGNVKVEGVNFIQSDSIVQYVKEAFAKFSTPEEIANYIGKHYGQFPRNVFVEERKVVFANF